MNYANTQSLGYQIAEVLYKKGAMATDQIAGEIIGADPFAVKSQVGRMCFEGDLESIGGNVQIKPHIRRHFAKINAETEVAGPRTFTAARPLSEKNMPGMNPLVKDRLREVHFITCSSPVPTSCEY